MAIATGWKGAIRIKTSDAAPITVAEMGSWSISGPTRNMTEVSSFGDTVGRQVLGTLTGQTVTFDGFWDATDTGLTAIYDYFSSGVGILACTGASTYAANFRLYANTDSDFPGYGYWALDEGGSTVDSVYITGSEIGQSKDGLGTISFTAAVVGNDLKWTVTT